MQSMGVSDVWALGAVLYEMLTGDPPFYAPDTYALLYAVVEKTPQPLGVVAPDVERVVLTALAKKPEQRYSTMREFAEDLRQVASEGRRRERNSDRCVDTGDHAAAPKGIAVATRRCLRVRRCCAGRHCRFDSLADE